MSHEPMLTSSPLLLSEILERLEEARRRIGVRQFRHIRRMKVVKSRKGGAESKVRKAQKIRRAILRGPVHNRHRR
jgi:hypothetical protein